MTADPHTVVEDAETTAVLVGQRVVDENSTIIARGRGGDPLGSTGDGRLQHVGRVDVLVRHIVEHTLTDRLDVDGLEDGGAEAEHRVRSLYQVRDALDRFVGVARAGIRNDRIGEQFDREPLHLARQPSPDVSEFSFGRHRVEKVLETVGDELPERRELVSVALPDDPAPSLEIAEHAPERG